MCLAKADTVPIATAIERWRANGPSRISHHGQECCRAAKKWLVSVDYSLLTDGDLASGTRWIRDRYTWGPSKWPLHWCEAIESRSLDCGALAALARELFAARGFTSLPAQLVQQFSEQDSNQWCKRWRDSSQPVNWILGDLAYHEACALLVQGNHVKIWDPTDSWWISPEQSIGYAATLAICVDVTDPSIADVLIWGSHHLRPNQWTIVARRQSG